jgi:hypothetical protein
MSSPCAQAFFATAAVDAAKPSIKRAQTALARADAVCFDVDSTVITVEAIDELAAFSGSGAAVAAVTASAMGGTTSFTTALDTRLKIIQPTTSMMAEFLKIHPFTLTPHVAEVISGLQARGTHVYLVSGGFTQVGALARQPQQVLFPYIYMSTCFCADDFSSGPSAKNSDCTCFCEHHIIRRVRASS